MCICMLKKVSRNVILVQTEIFHRLAELGGYCAQVLPFPKDKPA